MSAWDAVVVGAGVSGLAAGILLAEEGRKVLLLEQHKIPGGLLQRFRRKGIPFETGFHYIGGAGEGGPLRRYLRRLDVLDRIRLEPMDPEGFDEIVIPGRRFPIPQGVDRIRERLRAAFPAESAGIDRYFERLLAAVKHHDFFAFESEDLRSPEFPREPPRSLVQVLREEFRDPDLAAILAAHGGLYGVPADRSPFDAHSLLSYSYFHSAHGIEGGGDALAAALVARFRELGGELRLGKGVRSVGIRGRQVARVVAEGGEEFEPGLLVWTAHPRELLQRLDGDPVPSRHVRRIESIRSTHSAFLVHAVARGVPAPAARRNWMWFREPRDAWEEGGLWADSGALPTRMAILPCLALPEAPGDTVFQACIPLRAEDCAEGGTGRAREEWKLAVARRLVPIVEECVPAWAGRIEVVNVSTPRAMVRFVRSHEGSCYGLESSVECWGMARFPASLSTRGLLLVGQSMGLPGVLGSILSAFVGLGGIEGRLPDLYLELHRGDTTIRRAPPGQGVAHGHGESPHRDRGDLRRT